MIRASFKIRYDICIDNACHSFAFALHKTLNMIGSELILKIIHSLLQLLSIGKLIKIFILKHFYRGIQ